MASRFDMVFLRRLLLFAFAFYIIEYKDINAILTKEQGTFKLEINGRLIEDYSDGIDLSFYN